MSIQWNNEDYLAHYGVPRRSGRYKWGSGKDPYHHGASLPSGSKKTTKKEYKGGKNPYQGDGNSRGKKRLGEKVPTDEDIDNMIKRGDSKKIIKNFEYFSDQELSRAVNRANYKKRLKEMDTNSVMKGMKTYKQVIQSINGTLDVNNKLKKKD